MSLVCFKTLSTKLLTVTKSTNGLINYSRILFSFVTSVIAMMTKCQEILSEILLLASILKPWQNPWGELIILTAILTLNSSLVLIIGLKLSTIFVQTKISNMVLGVRSLKQKPLLLFQDFWITTKLSLTTTLAIMTPMMKVWIFYLVVLISLPWIKLLPLLTTNWSLHFTISLLVTTFLGSLLNLLATLFPAVFVIIANSLSTQKVFHVLINHSITFTARFYTQNTQSFIFMTLRKLMAMVLKLYWCHDSFNLCYN